MARHQQAFHQFTLDHVSFHDFGHVGFSAHPIPDPFRINDDARTIFAMIQTSRLVGANHAVDPEPLNFLFEEGVKFHGSIVRATSPGVSFRALVDADKDMMFESTHVSVSFLPLPLKERAGVRGMVRISTCQKQRTSPPSLPKNQNRAMIQEGSFRCPVFPGRGS